MTFIENVYRSDCSFRFDNHFSLWLTFAKNRQSWRSKRVKICLFLITSNAWLAAFKVISKKRYLYLLLPLDKGVCNVFNFLMQNLQILCLFASHTCINIKNAHISAHIQNRHILWVFIFLVRTWGIMWYTFHFDMLKFLFHVFASKH